MVAHGLPVHVHITGRLYTGKVQINFAFAPVEGYRKAGAIKTHAVGIGDDARRISRKRVFYVGEHRSVVAGVFLSSCPYYLPIGRNGHIVPIFIECSGLKKVTGDAIRVLGPLKFPGAIEHLNLRRFTPIVGQSLFFRGKRDTRSMALFSISGNDRGVFPIGQSRRKGCVLGKHNRTQAS